MNSPQTEKALEVCESLIAEHAMMEGFLLSLEKQLNRFSSSKEPVQAEREKTQALLNTISQEINVHFACEERALFPAVSPYHPMVLMEAEHEELVALRDALMAQFTNSQFTEFQKTSREFIDYLGNHMARENGGIFPVCEQSLSTDEKQQVIDRMKQIRTQAKTETISAIIRPEKSFRQFSMNLDSLPERPLMIELLAETSDLQIKHLTIRSGESLPSHWSPKKLFILCILGEAIFTAEQDKPVKLKPGAGVLLDPQLPHDIQANSDCHLLLILQDVKSPQIMQLHKHIGN